MSERRAIKGFLSSLVIFAVIIAVIGFTFGYVVPPGMFGVRETTFGPGVAFSTHGLSPGYHWSIPFYSRLHLVPQTIQVVEFNREEGGGASGVGALALQTADRAAVDVDISVLCRFYPEPGTEGSAPHGGPADLFRKAGITAEGWENHIRKTADDSLKRTLGKLSAAEFYDANLREAQIKEALSNMNSGFDTGHERVEGLLKDGIKVEAILLRRYTYRDDRIDNAIFQKNLQNQEERLNLTASKLAEAQAEVERVAAEWDAKIRTLQVEGENKDRVIRSEGDLYENKKKAEGDLEVAKAKAEVDKLRAGALAQSAGADIYVARQLAPMLSSLKGGVVTDLDPYDLNGWMRRLGLQGNRQ